MPRLLALLAVCFATLAQAGWSNVRTVPGTPQDLVVADGGVVVVSTSGASGVAVAILPDGGTLLALPAGNYVGAGLVSEGCLLGLQTNRLFSAVGCVPSTGSLAGSFTPRRFRITPGGAGLVTVTSTLDELLSATSATGSYALAGAFTWAGRAPRSLGVASISGAEVAVFNEASAGLVYSVDGAVPTSIATGFSSNDAVPFSRAGAWAVLAAASDGGLRLIPDLRSSLLPTMIIGLPAGVAIDTVAMSTDDGIPAQQQRGYGLATTAGGPVYSPIPDPSHVGEYWVPRVGAPALSGRVHCLDASWCAGFGAAGEVQVLHNASAPTFELDAGTLQSGVPTVLEVDAGDADGDPIFVSWQSAAADIVPAADSGFLDGRRVQLTAVLAGCSGEVPVTVTVWDGLAGHETSSVFTIPITSTAAGAAGISPDGLTVAAGSGPVLFTAFVDAGCQPLGQVTWTPGGSTANPMSWTPPRNVCAAAGQVVPISFTAGTLQAATSVTVTPWGPPETPVFPSPARQDAGTTVLWSPIDQAHVCALSPGFPGTALSWTYDDRGLTVTVVDGGLLLEAPACQAATFHAEATRHVAGSSVHSDAGSLDVQIDSALTPLSSATPFSMTLQYDAGSAEAFGTFSVTAECVHQRHLEALVELLRADGGLVVSSTFPAVPGPWSLPVPGGCTGGDFLARARLLEDGGLTGASDEGSIHAQVLPVVEGDLAPSTLEVRCGLGAKATLTLDSPAGTCAAGALTWTQASGPEVSLSNASGRSVELQTLDTSFALIGRSVELDVVVDAGADASASSRRTVTLTGPRFVAITARVSPLTATSEDRLEVELVARNTSACEVDAVAITAQLQGLIPDLDSARTDRGPLAASSAGDALTLAAVPLAAQESVRVRFTARPRLLGTPSIDGTASVRGVPVDLPVGLVGTSGCGCASTSPGPVFAVFFALWLRRRRQELS